MGEVKEALLSGLVRRRVPGGGFQSRPGSAYRADATAWGILALQAAGLSAAAVQPDRASLAADQQQDGRVSISPEHTEAYWPTSLAVLAWQRAPDFQEAQARGVAFLMKTSGQYFPKAADSPFGHDTTINGWPWIGGTHSWVMPTSLAILALRAVGQGGHPRVAEARRLLLDRQLPDGGWNYGNTTVFGQKLHPMPESTGAALSALAGDVKLAEVTASLGYLKSKVAQVRTPLALSWGLLGLGAWGEAPATAAEMIGECWARRERYSGYDTSSLALLLLALTAPPGLIA